MEPGPEEMRRPPPAPRLRERSLWGAQPEDRPAGAAPAARPPPPPPWPRPRPPVQSRRPTAPRAGFATLPPRAQAAANGRARTPALPAPRSARVTSFAVETTSPGVPRAAMAA